ncbi:cutinase family protein [Gordonia sp. N1V]|uniref:cutinase family protein n=1 Tax=Gordonia sp. N1V TaxID=3034163 RepID=UPI0023E1E186|nr:cutinase family protein [Gordonia sp. N1V]MDF3285041.1 cutinase family protein [Gordonia sp. N1V]
MTVLLDRRRVAGDVRGGRHGRASVAGFGSRVLVAAASLLVVLGVSSGPMAGSAAAAASGGDCASYMVYLVPGTWETHKGADSSRPVGMLAPVGNRLVKDYGSQLRVVYPDYSATAFNSGLTYAQSERDGVNTLVSLLKQCPDSRVMLGGYSQGADVAGDVAWMIGNGKGPIPASQVLAVGLLSDPKQGNAPVAGPQPGGTGIAGTRPGGFGALASVTRQICAPGDLYCGLNKGRDSFLAGLGKVLGSSSVPTEATSSSPAPGAGQAQTASLTSDYGNADFPGAASTAQLLNSTANSAAGDPQVLSSGTGAGELAQMATMAQQLLATFAPLADSQKFVKTTPGVANTLRSATPGSSLAQANTVLGSLGKVDVAGIVSNATKITQMLGASLGGSGANTSASSTEATSTSTGTSASGSTPAPAVTTAPSTSAGTDTTTAAAPTADPSAAATPNSGTVPTAPTVGEGTGAVVSGGSGTGSGTGSGAVSASDLTQLASTATQLAAQVAPVGSVPAQQLSTASQVLGTLKPDSIINQALAVVSTVVGTDYTGIVNNLTRLPQQVVSGDVRGAHATARALNVQFSPWVKLASVMDYKMAAQLVGMIPDTSGTTQIVSMVLDLLGNLDIIRLAKDVGQLQEVAWQVVETGNLLALSQLLPISLDLASVAVGVMTPTTKMSPEQLTAPTSAAGLPQMQQASTTGNAAGLFSTAAQLTQSQGAQDLTTLVKEGLTAANFYASNVHTSYNKFQIDGVSAVTWLANFFSASIR